VNNGAGRHLAARLIAGSTVGTLQRQSHGEPEKMAKIEMPEHPARLIPARP
jgi:hypothetical protein